MISQHAHTTTPFLQKKFPIVIVCDAISSPANIGGLFRISEALGVEEIIFSGPEIDFSSNRLRRTARNTCKKVRYSFNEGLDSKLEQLTDDGFELIGLEITNGSVPLNKLRLTSSKIAIIIGNERNGVSENILKQMSQVYHIEMYGENSSMNVIQATGIAIYTVLQKLNL